MAQGAQKAAHVWLVMIKAMRAPTRYAAAGIEGTGLGNSDFRVLEVLLHKGPLPVKHDRPNCRSDSWLDQYCRGAPR